MKDKNNKEKQKNKNNNRDDRDNKRFCQMILQNLAKFDQRSLLKNLTKTSDMVNVLEPFEYLILVSEVLSIDLCKIDL